ncbi:MAG: 2-C-methyl-D-erythritol 2,4-cyclodiphosphate synthase [Chitinispirillaceae bacterium]|nr:2-C-methyl-D-erythritol 2,4-cyclodiphosphate synthase [Chitinispirillaceae bacterium]
MSTVFFSAIGQDSHRFEPEGSDKTCILGGVTIPGVPGLSGNSDADVILHAVCNALSGLSGQTVLGAVTDRMCLDEGITDSRAYVKKALDTLGAVQLIHLSITIEAKRPHLANHSVAIRESVADLVGIPVEHVGLTATTGEGLTAFGRGEGVAVFVIASAAQSVSA